MTDIFPPGAGRRTGRSFGSAALLLFLILGPCPAPGSAAVSCHCFKDRRFDPARPEKSEPYILASTQNSFFAVAFGVPKKAIVQSKMSGAGGDDLWVAYSSARVTGERPGDLMAARGGFPSWAETLKGGGRTPGAFSARFRKAIDAGSPDGALASLAAAETIALLLGTEWRELEALRSAGATTAEMVASSLVSRWTDRAPLTLLEEVRQRKTTWGGLLHRLGFSPEEVEGAVRRLVSSGP